MTAAAAGFNQPGPAAQPPGGQEPSRGAASYPHCPTPDCPLPLTAPPTRQVDGGAASCSLRVRALLPPPGEPPVRVVLVDVASPRFILLRRFVNNARHAADIIARELDAFSRARGGGGGGSGSGGQAAPMASGAATHLSSSSSGGGGSGPRLVALLQATSMQVVLPASHASKTLDDHYAVARGSSSSGPAGSSTAAAGATPGAAVARRGRGAKPGAPAPARGAAASAGVGAAGGMAAAAAALPHGCYAAVELRPRHAFYTEALVMNVAAAAVGLPGGAGALGPAPAEFAERQGFFVPAWMQDAGQVALLVDGSRDTLRKHSSPAAAGGGGGAAGAETPEPGERAQQQHSAERGPPVRGGGSGRHSFECARGAGGDAAGGAATAEGPLSPRQAPSAAAQEDAPHDAADAPDVGPAPSPRDARATPPPQRRGKRGRDAQVDDSGLEPGLLLVRPRGAGSDEESASDGDGEGQGGRGRGGAREAAARPKKDGLLKQARAAAGRLMRGRRTVQLPASDAAAAVRGTAAGVGMAVAGTPSAAAGAVGAASAPAGTAPQLGQLGRGGASPGRAHAAGAAAGAGAEAEAGAAAASDTRALILLEGFELLAADVARCPPPLGTPPPAEALHAPGLRRPPPLGPFGARTGLQRQVGVVQHGRPISAWRCCCRSIFLRVLPSARP
jgi:hypothetical protein